jgi:cell division septation protein DedD
VSGNAGATVTAVTVTGSTTEFTLQIAFGGSLTAHIAAGAITDTFGNPNADFSGNYTVSGCPPSQYTITDGADTIVPGDTDTGNHGDDVDTVVALPFPFQLYDQTFSSVNVSSNGRIDFVVPNEPGGFVTACLPAPPNIGPYDFTIFPVWQDMRTDFGLSGCATFPGGNCGVFTSVSGTAPNRIFNIEWRTVYFADNASTANFEARLYENDPNLKFEVIVGTVQSGGDHNYVSGVQGNSGAGFFTQDFCDSNPPAAASHTYEIPPCASPTPTPTPGTPTPTPTPGTPTPTPTPTTPTPTPTVTPTPTPRVTPRPRPTPYPRPTP